MKFKSTLCVLVAAAGIAAGSAGCARNNDVSYGNSTQKTPYSVVERESLQDSALKYIERTVNREGVVKDPAEAVVAEKALRDYRNGQITPQDLRFVFEKVVHYNGLDSGDEAALEKAIKDACSK